MAVAIFARNPNVFFAFVLSLAMACCLAFALLDGAKAAFFSSSL